MNCANICTDVFVSGQKIIMYELNKKNCNVFILVLAAVLRKRVFLIIIFKVFQASKSPGVHHPIKLAKLTIYTEPLQ